MRYDLENVYSSLVIYFPLDQVYSSLPISVPRETYLNAPLNGLTTLKKGLVEAACLPIDLVLSPYIYIGQLKHMIFYCVSCLKGISRKTSILSG